MKEPWDELESELNRLQPSCPKARLTRRIEQELSAEEEKTTNVIHVFWRYRWLPVAAAAAVVLLLAVVGHELGWFGGKAMRSLASNGESAQSIPQLNKLPLRQIETGNYLLGAQAEGVVYVSDNLPCRKVRYQFLDAAQWRDDDDNLTVEVLVPREDVMLIPMRVY